EPGATLVERAEPDGRGLRSRRCRRRSDGKARARETARISFDRPHAAVCVRGDPERIAHVLENLLDNTRKYSAADSPIEISLTVQGAEAHLRVADHGIGVPDDERASLFTPFYRT